MPGLEVVGDFTKYIRPREDDDSSSAKRRRCDDERFKPGFILKVKVENFTTYTFAEFNLSPSLNMIIGPNGTGKSTLVAAICIGLGGKIELIKRKNIKSMIKTGQTRSVVEITLKNFEGEPPVTIRREFTEKETNWSINGESTNEKSIRGLRRRFSIQLDNLCHFLPQERVAEFASLSPEKLLLETERTLMNGDLLKKHEELIDLDESNINLSSKIGKLSERLEFLKNERDALEGEAKKFEEFQDKMKELELHEKLIPYAQLEDLKYQRKHIKKQRDDSKKALEKFSTMTRSIYEQLKKAEKELGDQEEKSNGLILVQRDLTSIINTEKRALSDHHEKIEQLQSAARALSTRKLDKAKELDALKKNLLETIKKKDDLPVPTDSDFDSIKEKRNSTHEIVNNLKDKLEQVKDKAVPMRSALKRLNDQISEKMNALTTTDKISVLQPNPRYKSKLRDDAYGGHIALRRQKHFRYFEAPVISCEVSDKRYAKYLEKVIDNNTLFAITLTSQNDYKDVSDFILKQYNIPMRVINGISNPRISSDREGVKRLGFDGLLSDFVTGPSEVLSMLYTNSKIDLIPVSMSGLDESQIAYLTKPDEQGKIRFRRFISGETLFIIHQSQYGSRQYFYSTEKINPVSFYFGTSGLSQQAKNDLELHVEELKRKKNAIKEEYEGLQDTANKVKSSLVEASNELNSCKGLLDQFQQQKAQRTKIEAVIVSKEAQIEKVETQAKKDYTEKIKQIENKIKEKYSIAPSIMGKLTNLVSKLSNIAIELGQENVLSVQLKNRVFSIQQLTSELEERKQILINAYNEAKRKYDEIKLSDAANKIRQQSRQYSVEEREALSNLVKSYIEEGSFTEALMREKIQLLEDEKSLMATADGSSIDNLRKKLTEIQRLENDMPNFMREKAEIDSRITHVKNEWEPELSDLVDRISLAFNKKFTKVASDGRVELARNDRFKDWKLLILVKFRLESELKVLDHQSQSGGERAVSIIFFIMSLQGLSQAPFRIVDEINQGMDPKNEKMAHRYLVHTACLSQSSQYFLVTPKLLTGLYYHPDMVVHCIYTGPLLDPANKNSLEPDFMDFNRLIST
ncbi:uncharacterized protein PRCAT00003110001 [Priceomyces carsonii]|uniref:uncharacterized protein n=1 Tax=Priceomyces carsonii TaxID=28549 RepID=UPI002EDB0CDD|nr:unnamed protein product [Priceomyces carsonii]